MVRCSISRLVLCGLLFAYGSLAADDNDIIRTAKSGKWSSADTWMGGKVPGEGGKVLILSAHEVTYDVSSPAVIRAINIAGKLAFARDRDTLLNVGLVKIEAIDSYCEEGFDCTGHFEEPDPKQPVATLEVGTVNDPIPAKFTAKIRLHAAQGLDPQSCPAIVCCAGRMDFHGAPLTRTWVKLGASAAKGAVSLTLGEPAGAWKAGDEIIVTPSDAMDKGEDFTEQRTIAAIDGLTLSFKDPFEHNHAGEGEFRAEVANLSRNVVVESADPAGQRGHTMYHRGSSGSISYAEFRHLGKKGVLGRYSLHYHLCGNTMRGSSVIGASIWDSHNRWLTIHGTNYLVVRDCVGYKSLGHGFFLEDGTEVYNVLDRNLAVSAESAKKLPKQVLPFDQNNGAGFWWTNSLNTFTRNVAAANDLYGFRMEATPSSSLDITSLEIMQPDGSVKKTDPRTLPFVRFEDNEVHSSVGLYGMNLGEGVGGVGPDHRHPFVVKNTKIWDVHYAFRPQVPSLLVENMTISSGYGVYHPNYDHHVYRNLTIRSTNTEPFNRGHDDLSLQNGILTVDGLVFENMRSGGMPLIQISDHNPTGKAESHFRNVSTVAWNDKSKSKAIVNLGGGPRPQPTSPKGVPIYLHDYYGPGKSAVVVSTRSPEYKANPDIYRSEPPLTGDESRVTDAANLKFPTALDPVDDLPPATVITHVAAIPGDRLRVRGETSDNGEIARVLVNDKPAKLDSNTRTWEIEIPASGPALELKAWSVDAAGNTEKLPHRVVRKR